MDREPRDTERPRRSREEDFGAGSGAESSASVEGAPAEGADESRSPDRDEGEVRQPSDRENGDLQEELDQVKDRHLRLAAEFENYRRRIQAELREAGARAQAQLVARLLDSLDDFSRITSQDPDHTTVESLLEGIQLVERKLLRSLEEAGVQTLDPRDQAFDPEIMEALVRVPADGPEDDDQVDQVFQPGFLFKGHLVRPARVSVRKLDG